MAIVGRICCVSRVSRSKTRLSVNSRITAFRSLLQWLRMQRNLIASEREGTSRTGSEMLPHLEPGITLLRTPGPRSTVLHQLALRTIRQVDGGAYWLDARNTASTYALHDFARDRRLLRRIRLARAFTAYQHFTLAERLINTVSPRTGCLVVPNAPSLYRDDDVPEHEAAPLFDAVVTALSEVAAVYDLPVLVTDAGPIDDLAESVAVTADTRYRAESTDLGYRVVGDDFETTVYWDGTGWQTTIPYWIDLCGTVDATVQADGLTPVTPAVPGGL
jgi:hypothetical protein